MHISFNLGMLSVQVKIFEIFSFSLRKLSEGFLFRDCAIRLNYLYFETKLNSPSFRIVSKVNFSYFFDASILTSSPLCAL